VAVRLRMKRIGRKHRPFFRICATDSRSPRDGKVIEEIGYYDPMVRETDARTVLDKGRVDYWLSVGAQPSDRVGILIKKYGTNGTHLGEQAAAFDRLKVRPVAPDPVPIPLPVKGSPVAEDSSSDHLESSEAGSDHDDGSDEGSSDNG
jgi:small subunit ribosomal protein S16